ncbi:MAG: glyoxalase superfamily protein [Pseudomonadota bacterium]
MGTWYVRTVFFVADVDKALDFYIDVLGFEKQWDYREQDEIIVAQVTRHGLELILNKDIEKAGNGRLFIALEQSQVDALRQEFEDKQIQSNNISWGMPVIEVLDPDNNQLYFAPP